MIETIQFTLNDKSVSITVDGDRRLLWVLRTDLGLTGVKYGCGEALCGACTVLVDNEAVFFLPGAHSIRQRQKGHHHRGTRQDAAEEMKGGRS